MIELILGYGGPRIKYTHDYYETITNYTFHNLSIKYYKKASECENEKLIFTKKSIKKKNYFFFSIWKKSSPCAQLTNTSVENSSLILVKISFKFLHR